MILTGKVEGLYFFQYVCTIWVQTMQVVIASLSLDSLSFTPQDACALWKLDSCGAGGSMSGMVADKGCCGGVGEGRGRGEEATEMEMCELIGALTWSARSVEGGG